MQYDQRRWSNSSTLVVYQMPTHQAHQGQHNLAENHNDCRGQQETNQTASRSTSPAERETSSRLVILCDQNTTHDELLRVSFCANKLSKFAPKFLTKKTMATSSPKTRQLATIFFSSWFTSFTAGGLEIGLNKSGYKTAEFSTVMWTMDVWMKRIWTFTPKRYGVFNCVKPPA